MEGSTSKGILKVDWQIFHPPKLSGDKSCVFFSENTIDEHGRKYCSTHRCYHSLEAPIRNIEVVLRERMNHSIIKSEGGRTCKSWAPTEKQRSLVYKIMEYIEKSPIEEAKDLAALIQIRYVESRERFILAEALHNLAQIVVGHRLNQEVPRKRIAKPKVISSNEDFILRLRKLGMSSEAINKVIEKLK